MKKWLAFILLAFGAAFVLWLWHELRSPYQGYSGRLVLVIRKHSGAGQVTDELVRQGVVSERLPFLLLYALGRRHDQTLKFGEYLFDRPLSATQVYDKLARGEVYLHTVVIPEGSNRYDMARIFHRELGLDQKEFLTATRPTAGIRDLDPNAPSLEGYLFPDTYRFPQGIPAGQVVQTMLSRFRQVYALDIRPALSSNTTSLHNVMTLASLVEKETPVATERPLIAGVFMRRLKKRMLLQSDPTVIYAAERAEGGTDQFKSTITEQDLALPSAYNTYLHAGLPPGPICSPGLASIRAALNPAPGKALYFVSNNHGGHVFANTLVQQNRNVARYRRERKTLRERQGVNPHP
jgi:UPF0755 protein